MFEVIIYSLFIESYILTNICLNRVKISKTNPNAVDENMLL